MPTSVKKLVRRKPKPRAQARPKRLSAEELVKLVRKARDARSDAEAKRIEDEFIRGFYGE